MPTSFLMYKKFLTLIRHVFIPHEGNDYKPHFFRELILGILLTASVLLLLISLINSYFLRNTTQGASVTASVLVDMANETRLSYHESPLLRSPLLDQAAELKSKDMVARGYFAHDSPDGLTPWHWLKEVGYIFIYAGENLAVNFTTSEDVENAWLNSPSHRANLLNTHFREIGMATIEGSYNNKPSIFVVQMFGTPAPSTLSTAFTTVYAPWYGKILFSGSDYIDTVYKILAMLIFIALLLMILIEVRRQHYKHILYGICLLMIILILISINRGFIEYTL